MNYCTRDVRVLVDVGLVRQMLVSVPRLDRRALILLCHHHLKTALCKERWQSEHGTVYYQKVEGGGDRHSVEK